MRLTSTRPMDGFASANLKHELRAQLTRAENHLKKYALVNPQDSAGYQRRVEALAKLKNLFKGLCGDEEPRFLLGGVGRG